MIIDSEKFNLTGDQERIAMGNFLDIVLPDTDQYYHTREFTEIVNRTEYDCAVNRYYHKNKELAARLLFEVKVRSRHYPSLLIEKYKLDKLLGLVGDPLTKIYYVNFTPQCTVVHDLLKLNKLGLISFKQETHNVKTVESFTGKAPKEVAYLDVTHGKCFDFVFQS